MNKALLNGLFEKVLVAGIGGTYNSAPPTAFVSVDNQYKGYAVAKVYDNKSPLNILTEEIYDD